MHTKGPWTIEQTGPHTPIFVRAASAGNICHVFRDVLDGEPWANARLIEKASEMAELLNDSRLNPPCDGAIEEELNYWFLNFDLWRRETRAILAKIEGREAI